MEGICGANCSECKIKCSGCKNTNGCPFGKECFIAKYILTGGKENYLKFKKELIDEINLLNIEGMPKIENLYPLNGSFVNLEYILPNNKKVKLLDDDEIYLGIEVKNEFDEDMKTCYGVVANMNFILVCEYYLGGNNSEIVLYKRR